MSVRCFPLHARHHDPHGPQGRPRRHRRRRPGEPRPDHREGQRQEGAAPVSGVIGGFYGSSSTADAFTLFERLEGKLEQYPGQLTRACVELTKDWRTDRYLPARSDAMPVADREVGLLLSGSGDVLEPEGGVMAIGSGGNFALAAARALADPDLDAEAIVRRSLAIAAEICVYTNRNIVVETLESV